MSARGEGGDEVGTVAEGRGGGGARTSCLSGRGDPRGAPKDRCVQGGTQRGMSLTDTVFRRAAKGSRRQRAWKTLSINP